MTGQNEPEPVETAEVVIGGQRWKASVVGQSLGIVGVSVVRWEDGAWVSVQPPPDGLPVLQKAVEEALTGRQAAEDLMDDEEVWYDLPDDSPPYPTVETARSQANYGVGCSTCDGGGCPDCTDPA